MSKTTYRTARMGEEIKKIISSMIMNDLRDPRLTGKIIGITGVDVTRDGSYATCYVTILDPDKMLEEGTEEEKKAKKEQINEELIEGLESASPLFRREIGKNMHIRRVPELIFKVDKSMDYGHHIDRVIEELHREE